MSINERSMKHLLWWLVAGTRGGITRAQIIQAIKKSSQNANQLAGLLNRDYRTIRHHLDVLTKHRIIKSVGDGYGAKFFLSHQLEENYTLFEEIMKRL